MGKIMVAQLLALRDLRVQTLKERKEGRLTKIPNNFFDQIKNLENQIRNVIDQSKDNVKRFEKSNSDMRKLMDLKLELHKLRERKLTDLAREKVNGQNPDSENVHSNESEYLESICSVIEKHRENTLLSTDFDFIPEISPDKKKETTVKKKEEVEIEEKVKVLTEKNVKGNIDDKSDNSEYLNVKVLEDLPTFTGMDAKNYTLKSGDTESIPKYNARMLSDAGKVKLVNEVKV
tara:strand:- start:1827 stop:2525 length:699 start_codon:yes stop_codon:yes gene_type:complete